MDKKIKEFEIELVNLVNNADIPAGAAYYILKDVLIKVQNVFQNNIILEEQQEQQKKQQEQQQEEKKEQQQKEEK